MGNQKWGIEVAELEGDDESRVADLPGDFRRKSDLVADPPFVNRVLVGDQKYLVSPVPQPIFQLALPIVTALQPQDIGPNLVPCRREFRAQPEVNGLSSGVAWLMKRACRSFIQMVYMHLKG